MKDIEASIPRTPTQAVLRIVSVIMLLLGILTVIGGLWALVVGTDPLGARKDLWTTVVFAVIILVVAGLLILTAALGLVASDNSARIEPYRFLCYLVGLVVLIAIVWGWGMGTILLFNPVVLVTTIIYVLICSTLADKVKEEHDAGVRGTVFLRSRHQRTLHVLSEVILLKGTIAAIIVTVMGIALFASDAPAPLTLSGLPFTLDASLISRLIAMGISAAVDIISGALGIRGSNQPKRIRPFFVLCIVALGVSVFQMLVSCLRYGSLGGSGFDLIFDLLFMGACTYMSVCILHQPPLPSLEEATKMADKANADSHVAG